MKQTFSYLTKREFQVLELVANEYSNKEIAHILHVSVATIETHRKNLFMKLGAKNMAGMIKRAFDRGILTPTYHKIS